jgi:site-specific recombinase XerD
MDGMTIEEEWMASILKEGTRAHHKRGLRYFTEYMGMSAEEITQVRQKERNFETRIVMFYKWLIEKKGLSENSARSDIIGVQAFFSYLGMPLNLKHKLPDITMKLDGYRLTVEDLQKLFKYGDLEVKAWISLSRDCPARIGDLLELTATAVIKEEMLIKSKKENVVGKVYLSPETMELLSRSTLPKTQAGVDKLLVRACKDAGIDYKINQHMFRKLWISTAINLGIQEMIIKILSFKAVDKAMLTYFLDRNDLKTSWEKVIQALPLMPTLVGNGHTKELVDKIAYAIAKMITRELHDENMLSLMTPEQIIENYVAVDILRPVEKKKDESQGKTKDVQ